MGGSSSKESREIDTIESPIETVESEPDSEPESEPDETDTLESQFLTWTWY
jgi:hypothetical protein